MNDEKKGILNVNALKKLEETKKMKVHWEFTAVELLRQKSTSKSCLLYAL